MDRIPSLFSIKFGLFPAKRRSDSAGKAVAQEPSKMHAILGTCIVERA
jgi:hypothetical protein